MANNKVQLADGTVLVDLTDTTATASDVASGKYFYNASGVKVEGTASGGGTGAISVVDTTDSHGGTVRTITAIDISDTTAVASDVAQGKYFYTAQGVKTAGTASGGTPSATQHSIYFEFSDSTDTTITAYWDNSFISNAITATTPTTYGQKTVTLAQLDGVTWYQYTPGTWETFYNDSVQVTSGSLTIESLSDLYFSDGETWRVTWNGTEYLCQPQVYQGWMWCVGNMALVGGGTNTGEPFLLYNYGGGAMNGNGQSDGTHTLKLERQVTS